MGRTQLLHPRLMLFCIFVAVQPKWKTTWEATQPEKPIHIRNHREIKDICQIVAPMVCLSDRAGGQPLNEKPHRVAVPGVHIGHTIPHCATQFHIGRTIPHCPTLLHCATPANVPNVSTLRCGCCCIIQTRAMEAQTWTITQYPFCKIPPFI